MEVESEISKLIDRGKFILLLSENEKIRNVSGINKFRRKVKKELLFLEEVLLQPNPIDAYVKCTNLQHLEALISKAIDEVDCVSILQVFKFSSKCDCPKKLVVDIVSHNGARWNKISARNPRALTLNSSQNSVFGVRSVIDQANDYLECAQEHPHLFQTPDVVFHFASGIEASLATELRNLGVCVSGTILNDESGLVVTNPSLSPYKSCRTQRNDLNLDVTAMMAYVSSSTNGGCYAAIDSVILADQAKREQSHHVKEMLDNIFEDKELLCCKTAEDDFRSILKTVAGIQEKQRAEELLKRITIVPDSPSERSLTLVLKGKIKQRSIIIFGTGDELKIPTVTANAGFVRAAQHQGINFVVFVHESRALTEAKEVKD